jgi:hypothetical protein
VSRGLEAELWRAIRIGRRVDLLEALGISPTLMTVVGCDFVEFRSSHHGTFYDLREDGAPALIVGVVGSDESRFVEEISAIDLATGIAVGSIEQRGGSFVYDLVAIELEGARIASRKGWATAFNEQLIEKARWAETSLDLLSPLSWLREPDNACAISDWTFATYLLRDIQPLVCENDAIAQSVRHEFVRHHLPLPAILVPA